MWYWKADSPNLCYDADDSCRPLTLNLAYSTVCQGSAVEYWKVSSGDYLALIPRVIAGTLSEVLDGRRTDLVYSSSRIYRTPGWHGRNVICRVYTRSIHVGRQS